MITLFTEARRDAVLGVSKVTKVQQLDLRSLLLWLNNTHISSFIASSGR